MIQILEKKVRIMRDHPNYLIKYPIDGESQISFSLRCASHLVSPPQQENESYDIECVVVRDGILSLKDEVEKIWSEYENSKHLENS